MAMMVSQSALMTFVASHATKQDHHPTLTLDDSARATSMYVGGEELHQTLSPQSEDVPEGQEHDGGHAGAALRTKHAPGSPNAKSIKVTQSQDGEQFIGTANQHPSPSDPASAPYRLGVSIDRNRKCRRTMEDAHSFCYSFGGVIGQGFFAVFDGHAGKHAAEWCGQWFHEYLLKQLITGSPDTPVPDLLNSTFQIVDSRLSQLAAAVGTHSGCTAVTAFLRLEQIDSGLPFAPIGAGVADDVKVHPKLQDVDQSNRPDENGHEDHLELETIESATIVESTQAPTATTAAPLAQNPEEPSGVESSESSGGRHDVKGKQKAQFKRTLYTANVGDARAVLCRRGKAVRLTYDHKGSDAQEAKRITDAGGFVMNNRVNGVLAVTRSLGDSSMKEFVVGSPYTTETTLGDEDEFLIIACDGLWDVCEDQAAVDLIKSIDDAQEASQTLLDHALSAFSTDNLSVMVVSFRTPTNQTQSEST